MNNAYGFDPFKKTTLSPLPKGRRDVVDIGTGRIESKDPTVDAPSVPSGLADKMNFYWNTFVNNFNNGTQDIVRRMKYPKGSPAQQALENQSLEDQKALVMAGVIEGPGNPLPDEYLYHGTRKINADSIRKIGLNQFSKLTSIFDEGMRYAQEAGGSPGHEPLLLRTRNNPSFHKGPSNVFVNVKGPIPSHDIEMFIDGEWKPLDFSQPQYSDSY